jgi:hypothetical protein
MTRLSLVALLALASPAAAQDTVLGLLSLPEVFGNGPCHPFEPAPVSLYATPDARSPIATIRVDQHWSFAPHGGCEGLEVGVHRGSTRTDLPTREYAAESPAAIVLEQRDRWFKIRLSGGAAWLLTSPRDRFQSMEELFAQFTSLTSIAEAQGAPLADAPGAAGRATDAAPAAGAPVRVLGFREAGDRTWIEVEVLSHSVCDGAGPPAVIGRGWLPAHTTSGEPTVWFSSRGC